MVTFLETFWEVELSSDPKNRTLFLVEKTGIVWRSHTSLLIPMKYACCISSWQRRYKPKRSLHLWGGRASNCFFGGERDCAFDSTAGAHGYLFLRAISMATFVICSWRTSHISHYLLNLKRESQFRDKQFTNLLIPKKYILHRGIEGTNPSGCFTYGTRVQLTSVETDSFWVQRLNLLHCVRMALLIMLLCFLSNIGPMGRPTAELAEQKLGAFCMEHPATAKHIHWP